MNNDILKGNWLQIRGEIKKFWGDLTDDDLKMIEGDHDKLIGRLQERYGYTRDQAEQEYSRFEREVSSHDDFDRGMGGTSTY